MTQEYISVLGYGVNCSDFNKEIAFQAGRKIALCGLKVCAGNLSGTFHHAFKGAKMVDGHTSAILEITSKASDKPHCDEVTYVTNTNAKHQLIAEKCLGAIVIGGGEGTKKLIARFLKLNKIVVAIECTGGVVNSELDDRVEVVTDIEKAINCIRNLTK